MENFRAMAIFTQVVECGSFSATARKLGVTKSAVSQQISQLEEELGTRLLQRTTRQLSLTEAGDMYLSGCRQMVEVAEAANQKISTYRKEPSGTLRISCSQDFAVNHLIPLLGPFFDRYPKLALDIDGSDQIVDLVAEQIDLAIRIGPLDTSGWVARKLGDFQEILVASPGYLKQHGSPQSPADLVNHRWVAFTRKSQPYQLQLMGPDGQKQNVRLYGAGGSNSSSAAREMIKAGLGIGQILRLSGQSDIENGSLVEVLADYRTESIGIYAVYPQKVHLPLKVRAVIDYLVENKTRLGVFTWGEVS